MKTNSETIEEFKTLPQSEKVEIVKQAAQRCQWQDVAQYFWPSEPVGEGFTDELAANIADRIAISFGWTDLYIQESPMLRSIVEVMNEGNGHQTP